MELLRVRFDEQARGERRKQASLALGSTAGTLKPWREVVTPHRDVASGRYQQAEFAADLWQAHLGEGTDEYRDPVEFVASSALRTASCAEFAGRRLIGAPVPLSRHAQEGLDPRRRDPPGETAPVPAGGAQPGRSGPASRRGAGRQASRHSDDVLRRSTADGQVDRIVRVRVCPPADTSAQTSAAASARRKPPAEQQPDNGGVDARSRPPRPSPRTRARGRAGRRSRAAGISSRAGAAPPRAAGRAGARCRAACPRREASTGPAPANGESPRPRSGHGVPFMSPLPVRNGRRTGCRRSIRWG